MVRDIDDIADDRTRGVESTGEQYHDTFLRKRPQAEWSPHIDATAKDLNVGIQIGDLTLTEDNFGRELGYYYRRGLKKTAGRYADLPSVLDETVDDADLGMLAYKLNQLSYEIASTDLGVENIQRATEALIEKLLTRHVGADLSTAFELTGTSAAEITTELFKHETIAANAETLLSQLKQSDSENLLSLLDTPQMMTPLWAHQRKALEQWCVNDRQGYVDMATATGKTVLGLAAIALTYGELHPTNASVGTTTSTSTPAGTDDVLIVAHSELILEQWRREFENHLNIPQERTSGGDDITLEWGTVHFRTPQSLVNDEDIAYELVLLDEAHHYATGSEWGSLLDEFDGKILAMSGSVDDAGSDSARIKKRLKNSVGPELKRYSITDARADGVIPSFDWEVHYAPYGVAGDGLENITVRADTAFRDFQKQLQSGELTIDTDRRLKTYEDIRRFSHTTAGGELKQENDDFRDLVTRLFSRRTKRWNLSPVLEAVVELVVEHHTTEKVVVLADSNSQLEELESRLTDVVAQPSTIYTVVGAQSRNEQREVIETFDEPERTGVLLGTGDLLGEGVDMQHASVAINMATGGVNQELVQRIGRVLRNPQDTPKHAMFYNVVGVPPTAAAAVPREDGKRLIEQAAGFCSLGRRFDKLPGFAITDAAEAEVMEAILSDGAEFIETLDAGGDYTWKKDEITPDDLQELHGTVSAHPDDIETILGEWEQYAWQHSEDEPATAATPQCDTNPSESANTEAQTSTETNEQETDSESSRQEDTDTDTASDEELLEEIRRLAHGADEAPTKTDMRTHGDYLISQYETAFGSWSKAIIQAGYTPKSQQSSYTRQEILTELHTVAATIEGPLSIEAINEYASFSASVVYDHFASLYDARDAVSADQIDIADTTDNSDAVKTDVQPNPLSELYELFRTFSSLLNRVIKSDHTAYRAGDTELMNSWKDQVAGVAFGDGLSDQHPHLGEQQSNRTDHTMGEYRAAYGDGERITQYQCVPVEQIAPEDAEVLAQQQILESDEPAYVPVAPESQTPLPIVVTDDSELEAAMELLAEFPAEPPVNSVSLSAGSTTAAEPDPPESESQTEPSVKETNRATSEQEPTSTAASEEGEETAQNSDRSIFWDRSVSQLTEFADADPSNPEPVDTDSVLDNKIDEWKSQLLDLTRRNKLISFEPTKSKSLPFETTDPISIATELDEGETIYIQKASTEETAENREPADSHQSAEAATAGLVPTRDPDAAADSLHRIGLNNKQYLRERGVNSLYLSLGMLRWFSTDYSDEANRSPLFLAPVELVETNLKDGDRHNYVLRANPDGLRLNPALRKKLASERSIQLPTDESLALAKIDAAFESVYETLRGFERWTIQPDVVLGIFDFSKFSLYSDLERNRAKIKDNPIVQALTDDIEPLQQAEGDITTPSASELDSVVDPADMYQVLDADSSQQEAIEAAKRGKSFVLQGPPGTGKSQTIANIIAEKLADGDRVLFVSEKQAALNVVKTRLDEVGIGRFCLEVHGEKANNNDVLGSLETELRASQSEPAANRATQLQRLRDRRDKINQYGEKLAYVPDGWETSVYDALGIVSDRADAPRIDIGISDPLAVEQEELNRAVERLKTLARFEEQIDTYESSQWRHTTLQNWGVDTTESMRRSLTGQRDAIQDLKMVTDILATDLGVRVQSIDQLREMAEMLAHLSERPEIAWQEAFFDGTLAQSDDRVAELAELEQERQALLDELSEHYERSFFSTDGAELNNELAAYGLFKRVKPSYWSLKRKVTNHTTEEYAPDHDQLVEDTRKLAKIQRIEDRREDFQGIIQQLGALYEGGETDWDTLLQAQSWVNTLQTYSSEYTAPSIDALVDGELTDIEPLLAETRTALAAYDTAAEFFESAMAVDEMTVDGQRLWALPLERLSETLQELHDQVPRLQRRVQFASQLDDANETICAEYIQRFLAGDYDSEHLVAAFEKRFYTEWVNRVYGQAGLVSFKADEMERHLEEFRRLDQHQQELAAVEIQHKVSKRQPSSDLSHTASPEEALLRRETEKERRHKPLRELFDEAGSFITQLKPCFMMSPLSVAQYVKTEAIQFDTVVFDEASQVMPQDAVSSLIRADQAIIAGDSKQLPPTSFFQTDVETTEDVRTDLDSILEEAAAILPEKTLRWHYRSQTEELIQFSNHQYYANNLRTFPENNPDIETGVFFEYVEDGVYDRGGSRQNVVEAQRVLDLVAEHADAHAEKSLGVIAFSSAQEQAIRDELAERRKEDPVLDAFVGQDDVLDEFFIKNLEMVQGDERDRMIFSVGYGPAQDGTVSSNFGPLNKSGGERRLNVAVTRAKEKITVVSSMLPGDIDLSGSQSTGAQHFKDYLEYARKGEQALIRSDRVTSKYDFDSAFEEAVYHALDAEGYEAVSQVESSGYSIDLAIKHPDRPGSFVLGVECDGAAYRSSKTARDRDRTRQMVLEELGWTIHRIWSPDWASNRDREIQQINAKIESLLTDDTDG